MKGQILVTTALMIAIVLMTIVISVHEAQMFFLSTRSIVVREVVGAITSDFQRALAATLAVATRGYYNYSRFKDLCGRYGGLGYTEMERHNFTAARLMALSYLHYWREAIMKAYSGYGVQVNFEIEKIDISELLGRRRYIYNLSGGYWYYPSSASVTYARLKLNLTNAGFYGWESPVMAGLFLTLQQKPVAVNPTENTTTIRLNVRVDSGEPYPYLLTKGWIEIYYPEQESGRWTGAWKKAEILDVYYEGIGNYTIKITPAVNVLSDPLTGQEYAPLLVVVSDHRGILVEALTYNRIVFKIKKNTPDTLIYYTEQGQQKSIDRPSQTPHEIYTIDFSSDLRLFWLDMELYKDPTLKIPPLPFMPIKQLRVNVSHDGTVTTLRERPLQVENWTKVKWYDREVWVPHEMPDPTTDIRPYIRLDDRYFATRFVFQVPFPRLDIKEQWVVIWWNDSLDALPKIWGTNIKYLNDPSQNLNDIIVNSNPGLRIELIGLGHTSMRGYVDYGGVAALDLRSLSDEAFGPWNIHSFGDVYCGGDQGLGRFRPYGEWNVLTHYLGKYSWMQAPIRILAILDTSSVASVYDCDIYYRNPTTGYYSTLAILQVINGSRYVPLIMHIHWQANYFDYNYWLYSMMGGGDPEKFAYMTGWKAGSFESGTVRERYYSDPCPSDWGDCSNCYHAGYVAPGLWAAHWNQLMGRGVIGNENFVELLEWSYNNGYIPAFYVTRCDGPTDIQNSLEVKFANGDVNIYADQVNPLLDYWLVMYMFDPPSLDEGWKGLFIYAPMFWKKYAPEIISP